MIEKILLKQTKGDDVIFHGEHVTDFANEGNYYLLYRTRTGSYLLHHVDQNDVSVVTPVTTLEEVFKDHNVMGMFDED